LAALEPPRRRWLAPSVAAGMTALVATGAAFALVPDREAVEAPDVCAQASAPAQSLWTEPRRLTAVQQLGPAFADQTIMLIDSWVASWSEAATRSCEDVHVRQLYSEQALDRRGLCLARSMHGFDAFLRALDSGEITTTQ